MPLIVLAWKLSSLATMTWQSSFPCHGYCLPLLQRVLPHAFYSPGLEAIIISKYDTKVQPPMSWLLSPTATNRECCHMPWTVVAWKLSSSAAMKGKSSLPCYCHGRLASTASNRECCLALVLIDWLIDDCLYSAILRALEQTHCTRMWFYMSD